jgi:hypothetical protein
MGPLYDRVKRSCAGIGQGSRYYSPSELSSLSLDEDFEHFWYAICLDEFMSLVLGNAEVTSAAA